MTQPAALPQSPSPAPKGPSWGIRTVALYTFLLGSLALAQMVFTLVVNILPLSSANATIEGSSFLSQVFLIALQSGVFLATGAGLLNLRSWARIVAMVLAVFVGILAVMALIEGNTLGFAMTAAYPVVTFGVLLLPQFAAEFAPPQPSTALEQLVKSDGAVSSPAASDRPQNPA